jgi:hypothetical protein
MAEDANDEGMTLLGDAWFGYVKVREAYRNLSLSCVMCFPMWDRHLPSIFHMQAVVALTGKMKRHFTEVVKTSHGLFSKSFLQESMSTAPARS